MCGDSTIVRITSQRTAWGALQTSTVTLQLLFLAAITSPIAKSAGHLPARDFHSHRVISPRLYHGRHKREIDSTFDKQEEGSHIQHLTVGWDVDGQDFVLDLKLNRELIPDSYFEKYHHQGRSVVNKPNKNEIELCHYTGTLRDRPGSWAALSTCDGGVEGVIYDGTAMHHIQKMEQPDLVPHIENPHFMYNHEHVNEDNRTCGFHDTQGEWDSEPAVGVTTESFFDDPTFNRMLRYKRDISLTKDETAKNNNINVKGPWNANKRSRYVELVIVVDNRKYKEYGKDLLKVYRKCKDMANIANALYAPLNIYIALVGVDVWSEYDEITLSTNGDTTLTNFLHYRRERLVKEFPNDNAQLLTGIQFDSGVVGKALKGPICTYEFSGGVSMWHSEVIGLVATTMAHELGHNFGMEHDTENCECPDERCIMAPASSTMKPTFWSSCSLEYLALAFEHGMDYCLRNKPRTLFDTPVCGNGFVEPGEECDCGLKEHCDNPCCNPDTCKLFPNATCATGECCDFKTCKPKLPGTMCRFSEHECDLPEFCTGSSEFCPKDIFKVDGVPCKVGQAFCYQGTCRTHSDQCRLLWGPSGKKSDNQCYEQNRKGSRHGNCGYNRLNQSYIPCVQDDVRCGMLHCQHLNERLEFGMESVAILSHSFINSGGRIIPCRTALVDLGIDDVDPGLAPEGARCGDDSLCVNQKCMPVASLKIGPQSCPNDCNGHGVCNSLGHCHCDKDWAPPYCESPGAGGSLDSGPASNPDDASGLSTVLYILFLFILPVILVIVCITYYVKGDINALVKKSKPESGFITVERRRSKSRPPSRLNIDTKDISGPVSVETTNSLSSSPTHALLPRSTTQTSEISGSTAQLPSSEISSESKRAGRFSSSMLTGLGGITRGKSQGSKDDSLNESPPDSLAESCEPKVNSPSSYKSRTSNLLKSLNKSISFPSSFPSPKFRSAIKSSSDTNNKYEVKIEPRKQEDISPADPSSKENISMHDGVVPPPSYEQAVEEDHRKTVTTPTSSSADIKPLSAVQASTSFSTFLNKPPGRAATLPSSMSLGIVPIEKVETRVVLESKSPAEQSPPTQIIPDFRNNPKLAFPHSSSFTSQAKKRFESSVPASASASSITTSRQAPAVPKTYEPSWKKPPNPNSYINRNATAANESPPAPFTSNVQPLQSPFFKKTTTTTIGFTKPSTVTTVTVSPFTQTSSQPSTSTSSTMSSNNPNAMKEISPPNPASSVVITSTSNKISSSSPSSSLTSKPLTATSSTKTDTSTVESLEATGSPVTSEKPPSTIAPFKSTSKATTPTATVRPLISKPILQNTTPNAASLIAKAPSTGVSQSSILATKEKESDPFKPPRDKARRAVFCDPITLPSPTSPNNPPIIHQPHSSTEEPVGKIITPTWSTQPPAVAAQAQVCRIDDSPNKPSTDAKKEKVSPDPADKSGLSKLISNVKRTPSLNVADRPSSKEKEKPGKYNSLPRKSKIERSSLRNLEISNPILQTEVEHKSDLLPVCRSPDSMCSDSSSQSTLAPSSAMTIPDGSPRHNSPSMKRPAPPPPSKSDSLNDSRESSKDKSPEKTKSKYSLPWRSKSNKSSDASDDAGVHKVSSSDDIQGYKKPDGPATGQSRQRRPASIATSKPIRPNAPPPKPPPSRNNSKETSPEDIYIYDDAYAVRGRAPLADIKESISPVPGEPIYDTIKEVPETGDALSLDEFGTPVGSPTLPKKSPDTISTGSSAAEEDLMKEILKEMHTKSEGESIYSSLMRKDKKSRKKKPAE